MTQEYQLRVLPEIAANEQKLKEYLSKEKDLNLRDITATRILKRSIDARQRTIFVNLKVRAYIKEMPQEDEYERTIYNNVEGKPQVIVVGAGPGGLFAALRLVELGLRPIVIERGKDVRERKKDLAQISREHTVDPESNYSFGEGGAGAYSDGKLYTRSKKRGNVDKILNVFCVLLNEFTAGFNLITHKNGKGFICDHCIFNCNTKHDSVFRIHGCLPKLLGIHFTETFVSLNVTASAAA